MDTPTLPTIEAFSQAVLAHLRDLRDSRGRRVNPERATVVARWVYAQFLDRSLLPTQPWGGEQPAPRCGIDDPLQYAAWQFGGGKYTTRFVAAVAAAIEATK